MTTMVYDSGALVAIDRGQQRAIESHRLRLARGNKVIVPAPVAAQVLRDPPRQVRLMRTLSGCEVIPFHAADVRPVGTLLANAGTSDVVDGFVAMAAARVGAAVVTSDGEDIRHLFGTLGVRLPVLAP